VGATAVTTPCASIASCVGLISAAARRLFAARGFEQVTVADVAKPAEFPQQFPADSDATAGDEIRTSAGSSLTHSPAAIHPRHHRPVDDDRSRQLALIAAPGLGAGVDQQCRWEFPGRLRVFQVVVCRFATSPPGKPQCMVTMAFPASHATLAGDL